MTCTCVLVEPSNYKHDSSTRWTRTSMQLSSSPTGFIRPLESYWQGQHACKRMIATPTCVGKGQPGSFTPHRQEDRLHPGSPSLFTSLRSRLASPSRASLIIFREDAKVLVNRKPNVPPEVSHPFPADLKSRLQDGSRTCSPKSQNYQWTQTISHNTYTRTPGSRQRRLGLKRGYDHNMAS